MIRPEDAEFHPNDPSLKTWAETIGFWFAIPEESIYGNIYVLARPNVGATIASVNVISGINPYPFTVDMTDPHMHAPCPESMLHFELNSGLAVDVDPAPTGYRFRYTNLAGTCEMDLLFIGCMPAWDPHDPNENPLLEASPANADLGLGDAWAGGHLDFVGRVTGYVVLRGKRYEVDSMGGMDRSWGTRSELGQAAISYIHIPFDETLAFHLVTGVDLDDAGAPRYAPMRFGYVMDHGEVFGLTHMEMTGEVSGLVPARNSISLTDSRGRVYRVEGEAVASAPWYTFSPSYVTFQGLMRYELDGKWAYGLQADTYGIEFLASRTSRHGEGIAAYLGS